MVAVRSSSMEVVTNLFRRSAFSLSVLAEHSSVTNVEKDDCCLFRYLIANQKDFMDVELRLLKS